MQKKRLIVKLSLLSALAGPVVPELQQVAAAAGALKPAARTNTLRQVPIGDSRIRQVQHESQSRSLIPKLVLSSHSESAAASKQRASANPQPTQPRRYTQQQQQQRNAAQTATPRTSGAADADNRRGKRRDNSQPGLFKRIWSRVTSNDSQASDRRQQTQPQVPAGQPAPAVPQPPQLKYNGQGTAAQTTGSSQQNVPTKTASLSGQNVNVPPIPGIAAAGQQSRRTTLSGQLDPAAAGGHRKATSQPTDESKERFINPFDSTTTASNDTELLDLDSLVDQRSATEDATVSNDAASGQQDPSAAINARTVSATNEVQTPQIAADQVEPQDGPFNGQPVNLADNRTQTETSATAGEQGQEDAAEPIIATETDRDELEPSRVPELNEPALQLPPAADEQTAEAWIAKSADEDSTAPADKPNTDTAEVAATDAAEPLLNTSVPATDDVVATDPADSADVDAQHDPIAPVTDDQETPAAEEVAVAAERIDPALSILDDRARREQQRYRIMSRAGRAGFKGFCPVELRDNRELVDSRETYEARFGLQTYQFSSAAARTAFEANPARYAPAAGGSDVVLLVNTGEELNGSLDFCLWYRDRLYMFKSRETQQIFSRDPQKFASQY